MPSTNLGFIDYPTDGDTSWYTKAEDGLELWVERMELLGIPTYDTFSDLPSAGTPASYDATGVSQRQFAAVVDEQAIYRVNNAQGSWELWVQYDVTTARLNTDAVTSAKIASGAVGTTQLAADAVTASEIGAGAVGTTQLATDSVDADAIGTGAVNTDEIAADAVGVSEFDAEAWTRDNPNGRTPITALDPGDSYELSVFVPDTLTVKLYEANAVLVGESSAGGYTTDANLVAEIVDQDGTVQYSSSGLNSSTSGSTLYSEANNSGNTQLWKVRVNNTDGSATFDSPGAIGEFSVVVE